MVNTDVVPFVSVFAFYQQCKMEFEIYSRYNTQWSTHAHRKHLFKVTAIIHCCKMPTLSQIIKHNEYCFWTQVDKLHSQVIFQVWRWWYCSIPDFVCSSKSITICLKLLKQSTSSLIPHVLTINFITDSYAYTQLSKDFNNIYKQFIILYKVW